MTAGKMLTSLSFFLLLAVASEELWGRDYFISTKGKDSAPGTEGEPWQSVAKASQTSFKPGDRVLFEGGGRFTGTLQLGPDDSGTKADKVIVSSYGTGNSLAFLPRPSPSALSMQQI